jgi:hypothetical protein
MVSAKAWLGSSGMVRGEIPTHIEARRCCGPSTVVTFRRRRGYWIMVQIPIYDTILVGKTMVFVLWHFI